MSSAHQEPDYMKIFAILTILTVVEVGITYLPLAKIVIALSLIILAVAKAVLVVYLLRA